MKVFLIIAAILVVNPASAQDRYPFEKFPAIRENYKVTDKMPPAKVKTFGMAKPEDYYSN